MTWYVAAFLSAIFAALTSILAKIGIKDVNSNLATAIRTTVILVFTWGIAIAQGHVSSLTQISRNSYLFLILFAEISMPFKAGDECMPVVKQS